MSNYLPENLIIEILSWLPVKSLLKFKSVSKLWYKIIKSPYLISMHLKHNNGRPTNCLIAQYNLNSKYSKFGYEVLEPIGVTDQGNIIHNAIDLLRDRLPAINFYYICGPCYGIYYLWCPWSDINTSLNRGRFLWNPALNEIKKLPPMNVTPNISSNIKIKKISEVCGFGFDSVTVDYKVVVIKGYARDLQGFPLSIMIYSLRTDSWKYSRDLSKHYLVPHENSCHAFVNRSFYWLGYGDKNDVIIVIDLATEECQEIGLPDMRMKGEMSYGKYFECLMVYNGSVALVAHCEKERNFDIWTLKGTTWNKELTVKLDCKVRRAVGHFSVDNNLLVFDSPKCLILCDPNTEKTWKLTVPVLKKSRCKIVSAYMESLVPLNDRDFWERKDEDRENRNKCFCPSLNNGLIFV